MQISRKHRGRRMAGAGLATLGILGLVLTLFTLAHRPRWRIVTLENRRGTAAVAFDCPDDWVKVDRPLEAYRSPDDVSIRFRRAAPTGWLRWWNTHVLHVSEHPFNSPEIVVQVLTAKEMETSPLFRVKFDPSRTPATSIVLSNYRRNTERVSHPLGSAIHKTVDINLSTPGRVSPGGKTWLPRHIEALDIYPSEQSDTEQSDTEQSDTEQSDTKGQRVGLVTVSCAAPTKQYPQFKPVFDRVMQSVRLVKPFAGSSF